ncbi:hypothetical protein AMS68_007510 [Peltaster fructicola]|uniref:Uncharacterized protein n=1 Tax=Peltaster fructicola TaxID=286661 RepID=A0A6H0Y4R8_9PEZI|nr:hypothetical protein AMS68_007510 [Peltaster fructicola]
MAQSSSDHLDPNSQPGQSHNSFEMQANAFPFASLPTRPQPVRSSSSGINSTTLLLTEDDSDTSSQQQAKPESRSKRSYFRYFCTTFRLLIIYSILAKVGGWDIPEDEKAAFYKSRRLAFVKSLIHWLPVSVAVTLVFLNIWQYYIGGELAGPEGQDAQKLAALQFAAKLHELLMLASLSTIVFAYIRYQMAFGDGVTIGMVFAGQQFQSISNLWSIEFWSAVYNARNHASGVRRQRWFLVTLITCATLLGVSVGPSSANLMRPRLDWWPSGGSTFYLNVSQDALYSRTLDAYDVPQHCSTASQDAYCPSSGFEAIADQLLPFWLRATPLQSLPESIRVSDPLAVREMRVFYRSRNDGAGIIWSNPWTHAYVGLAAVADGVAEITRLWAYAARNAAKGKRFEYRLDASFSVDSYQPVVMTYCMPWSAYGLNRSGSNFTLYFPMPFSGVGLGSSGETLQESMSYYNDYVVDTLPAISSWLRGAVFDGTAAAINWINDTTILNRTGSSLLAVVALPAVVAGTPQYLCCNINMSRSAVTLVGTRNEPKVVRSVERGGATLDIFPTTAWAALTNPYLPSLGMDAFAYLAAAGGVSNATAPRTSPLDRVYAIESIIASMLANGLARMPYRASLVGNLKGLKDPSNEWSGGAWADELMPEGELGYGGNAYELPSDLTSPTTTLTVQARANGYAYSTEGATQKAALVVLCLYCVMAVVHTLYNLYTGLSSSTWDTEPELTALAVNSERSVAMHNTGAGIHSIKTMEQVVKVRTKDDRLELVFHDTIPGGKTVEPGHVYH